MAGYDEYQKQIQQLSKSIERIYEPFGNMRNYMEFANSMQAQIDMLNQLPGIREIHRQQEKYANIFASVAATRPQMDFLQSVDFSAITSVFRSLDNLDMMSAVRNFSAGLQNYNYDILSQVTMDAFERLDGSEDFDVDLLVDEIANQYEQEEVTEHEEQKEEAPAVSKEQRVKDIREWIAFWIAVVEVIISICSTVSTKPAVTYQNVTEINNYYTIEKDIDADCLNALSYRIIKKNNVMPRIKPDCSSQVMGHLNIGQIVVVLEKSRKWLLVSWENDNGEEVTGWIQNYNVTEFK